MSTALKWVLRIIGFLAVSFLLMLGGVFGPLAETMQVYIASLVTNVMSYFYFSDPALYAYYDSNIMENMWLYIYVALSTFAGVVAVVVFEWLVRLAKNS